MRRTPASFGEPADLGVLEAAAALRKGGLSASELLASCEKRITARNGGRPSFDGAPDAVNAWVRLYPELSKDQARRAEERVATQPGAPLLCGIPVGLKDLFAVEGLPLTASSRLFDDSAAEKSSTCWTRLEGDGMVLVGHTHTHELAAGGTTDQVGNPWNLAHSAGGSSGGSAAALACGMVPAALGTDAAGSLRIPAAMCGISSLKPTHGLVPTMGVLGLAPTFSHPGPMARSLADCAALLAGLVVGQEDAVLGRKGYDRSAPPLSPGGSAKPLEGLTIALTDRPEAAKATAEVAEVLELARLSCERLGARTVERPPCAGLHPGDFDTILLAEFGAFHPAARDEVATRAGGPRLRPSIEEFVIASRRPLPAVDYLRAARRRREVAAAWDKWFADHAIDLLLEPTVPTTAPLRGAGYEAGHAGGEGDPLIALTATWNIAGLPVAAFPGGFGRTSGLPVGLSLIGPRGRDAATLTAGIELQATELPPLPIVEPRREVGGS